jgi:hypothetical protein
MLLERAVELEYRPLMRAVAGQQSSTGDFPKTVKHTQALVTK